jgi:protein-S-isoprenylcysteine O-methyltransferase Ste14
MTDDRNALRSGTDLALRTGIVRRAATVVGFLVFNGTVLFVAAGRLAWTWAWVFLGLSLLSMVINGSLLLRTSPQTVAERGRPDTTRGWDKVVGGLWALALFVLVPLVAGLDVRLGWTGTVATAWNVTGAAALVVGLALAGWSMIVNAFFSTAVRIQTDRGQTVCRSGPYRFVRHPGYLGFVLQSLGTPVLLGSRYALAVGVVAATLMVVRTALEDRMLQRELAGYTDFVQDVHYRLCPGVW